MIRNDHIQYRYEVLEMVGRGSFGQVNIDIGDISDFLKGYESV